MITPKKLDKINLNRKKNEIKKNIFASVDGIQGQFRSFIEYHMNISNPDIKKTIDDEIENHQYLYQPPIIELDPIFLRGDTFNTLPNLNQQAVQLFKDFHWYYHQLQAFQKIIAEQKNIIVTTGTGSGKSMAFVFPIINYCLNMHDEGGDSEKGVKALIVYPMNALANSQYKKIVKMLHGTGVRVCLYTGQLPDVIKKTDSTSIVQESDDVSIESQPAINQDQHRDSEVLSREEAQRNPPDILITNYSMLEYILDRHADKRIFPDLYKPNFKFIVLDEIHTYEGSLGSHVAHLIRRFKNEVMPADRQTNRPICIGTSATIDSSIDEFLLDASKEAMNWESIGKMRVTELSSHEIVAFARKIFDEPFDDESIITARYYDLVAEMKLFPFPETVAITTDQVQKFSGTINQAFDMVETFAGMPVPDVERNSDLLGKLLMRHPATAFLYETLKANPMKLDDLEAKYFTEQREETGITREASDLELKAIMLAGSVAKVQIYDSSRDLFIFKIHQFYNKGNPVYSCITPDDFHFQFSGATRCSKCAEMEKERFTFPLVFCNNCGNEFFSFVLDPVVVEKVEKRYVVGPVYNAFLKESSSRRGFLCKVMKESDGTKDRANSEFEPPEEWYQTRDQTKLRKDYRDKAPEQMWYCPDCKTLSSFDSPDLCTHQDARVLVWANIGDFYMCPYCGTDYTDIKKEMSKFYSPLYTGRSTPVDVLAISALGCFDQQKQKMLLFSDNRQDAAFQSAHINDFYQKLMVRHALFKIIQEQEDSGGIVTLKNVGKLLHQKFVAMNANFLERQSQRVMFKTEEINQSYIDYYTFLALTDNLLSTYRLNPNLEKLGLLEIKYKGLDDLSEDSIWKDPKKYFTEIVNDASANFLDERSTKIIQAMSSELIHDLLITILNLIRSKGVINHELLNDARTHFSDWRRHLNPKAVFDHPFFKFLECNRYFVDTENFDRRALLLDVAVIPYQLFTPASTLVKSVCKFLEDMKFSGIDDADELDQKEKKEIAVKINRFFVNILFYSQFIEKTELHAKGNRSYDVYQLSQDKLIFTRATNPVECPKCKNIYYYKIHENCVQQRCFNILKPLKGSSNFFKQLYLKDAILEHPLVAEEHTSQIDLKTRGLIEDLFEQHEPGKVNAIVCTPTMELGVDIGMLPLVFLRNVPPSTSSYAQRAGRAGRDQNNSLVLTFCSFNLFSNSGPYDNYFYHHPEEIVSGKIIPPRFSLDSKKIMQMHIRGITMRFVSQRVAGLLKDMIDFDNKPLYPILEDRFVQMKTVITTSHKKIFDTITKTYDLDEFQRQYPWFTSDFINNEINVFLDTFRDVFNKVRQEYTTLTNERDELIAEFQRKGAKAGSIEHIRMKQIQTVLDEIRGKEDRSAKELEYSRYNTWNYLRNNGFLPNYGFPEESIKVQLWDKDKESAPIDNFRNPVVAIREFAPLARIYTKGSVYLVSHADYAYKNNMKTKNLYLCPECGFIHYDDINPDRITHQEEDNGESVRIKSLQVCENCGKPITPLNFKQALEFPSMRGYTREVITSQQESRNPGYFEIIYNYHQSKTIQKFNIIGQDNKNLGTLSFDLEGSIFALNEGRFDFEEETYETFNFCANCQKWLSLGEVTADNINKHINVGNQESRWKKGCKEEHILKDKWLFMINKYNLIYVDIKADTVKQLVDNSEYSRQSLEAFDLESFYYTLKNLMQQTLEHVFCLSDVDLLGFVTYGRNKEFRIVIYETEEGGSGFLKLLTNEHKWYKLFVSKMPEMIHFVIENSKIKDNVESIDRGCKDACYDCLKNYRNQFEQEYLNRHLVRPYLDEIISSHLDLVEDYQAPTTTFNLEDFDSLLERQFIEKLDEFNMRRPDQPKKPIVDPDSGAPFTNIDFFYNPKLCVFIDGPPHDPATNLRQHEKDENITSELELMGYDVFRLKLYDDSRYEVDFAEQLPKLKEKIERL